jgi:hypothetical protein
VANRTKWTAEKKAAFLDVIAHGGTATKAARAVGLARSRAFELRNEDPAFAEQWEAAWAEGTETMEDEGHRRATEGVTREKGVYHRGALVATEVVTEYSDTLLIFMLKGRKPETYRDNLNVEHGGQVIVRTYGGFDPGTV